jgi:protein-disulfide isomerase
MKRYLPLGIVAAVAILCLVGGALLYRTKQFPHLTSSKIGGDESIHVRGSAEAPVTIEEFADFECRACGTLAGVLNQLERDYHLRLRVVFRHFPLTGHKHAREAAIASEAAAGQDHFWEMHDLLYREQASWTNAPEPRALFNAYAKTLGLNLDRFKKDMESAEASARVELDRDRGMKLGVTSTPAVFLNQESVAPGNLNLPGLRKAIDAALKGEPRS